MIYYRLLRDNKESGPYSEEEMIAKGFKPYDLLWAEGRSAGWQYPSEIVPFKKFAPIVEEQPFDRFYKKQPPQQHILAEDKTGSTQTAASYLAEKAKDAVPPKPVSAPAYKLNVQALPGRHIHVTLPSGNTVNLTTLVSKKDTPDAKASVTTSFAANHASYIPVNTHQNAVQQPAVTEKNLVKNQVTVNSLPAADYQPVGKQVGQSGIPVEQTGQYQASGFSWTLLAAAMVGIATLVGLGIMIGLGINRDKNETVFDSRLQQKATTPKPAPVIITQPQPAVITAIPASIHTVPSAMTVPVKIKEPDSHTVAKTAVPASDAREVIKQPVANAEVQHTQVLQTSDEAVQHTKTPAAVPKINIEKNLSVTANSFKTGAFGGISNLTCTLVNNSSVPVESVEVEVEYIQANKKVYKTEKLFFKEVAAGGTVTMDAPGSTRGIKVTSRVIKANARETSGLSTTAKS